MEEIERIPVIKFIIDKLKGGYQPVLDYYNLNKPEGSARLCRADVGEGGFAIHLTEEEMKNIRKHDYYDDDYDDYNDDYNSTVRQLRFGGFGSTLTSDYHMGFTREETLLLFKALESSLGVGQVILI